MERFPLHATISCGYLQRKRETSAVFIVDIGYVAFSYNSLQSVPAEEGKLILHTSSHPASAAEEATSYMYHSQHTWAFNPFIYHLLCRLGLSTQQMSRVKRVAIWNFDRYSKIWLCKQYQWHDNRIFDTVGVNISIPFSQNSLVHYHEEPFSIQLILLIPNWNMIPTSVAAKQEYQWKETWEIQTIKNRHSSNLHRINPTNSLQNRQNIQNAKFILTVCVRIWYGWTLNCESVIREREMVSFNCNMNGYNRHHVSIGTALLLRVYCWNLAKFGNFKLHLAGKYEACFSIRHDIYGLAQFIEHFTT